MSALFPKMVVDALKTATLCGADPINMNQTCNVLVTHGLGAASAWIQDNRQLYMEGVMSGYEVAPAENTSPAPSSNDEPVGKPVTVDTINIPEGIEVPELIPTQELSTPENSEYAIGGIAHHDDPIPNDELAAQINNSPDDGSIVENSDPVVEGSDDPTAAPAKISRKKSA